MNIHSYLAAVRAKYATGEATEHSYRPALEALFAGSAPGIDVVNEPKRLTDVGAPDFVFRRNRIAIGWCEAKDLHIDLGKLKDANLDQKRRYLKSLPNLIYTNGLDFDFYRSGEKIRSISIATLGNGRIEALPENFADLEHQLTAFAAERPVSITSAKKLAEMMAGKAVLIKDIMGNALRADANIRTELTNQFAAFKAHLIHDIDADSFADIYAETIAYGLFAARLHDPTEDSFSRMEALELLPKSNPFLRSLFGYIAGVDLDDRIRGVIDDLCEVLRACNVHDLMKDFGRWTARNDPFLHFYETFLAEYNPAKRKARGVWYTPEPVVNFIVRAVDDVLKTEFGLADGLADTSKITIDWDTGQTDAKGNRTTTKKQVHRVQILDPATGTGTFLAEAVKQIAARVKGVAEGMWSTYVEQDLIPRLHGFELLMASYAMCHMKLDMMLTELGYKPSGTPPRLGVYLTNSLEEGEAVTQDLFAQWLANEAKSANEIKRQMPIMCVIGNPPYSGISQNMGAWIVDKIEDYKYVDGEHFGERKHWLHDDYVKFIRLAEHMIDKNGEGVLGYITNHGYLDNPTFRGMRHRLLETFDSIRIINLHGNSNKKEIAPDGSADKNVFDIQQGVAIIIAAKTRATPPRTRGRRSNIALAEVKSLDLWGSREAKNDQLWALELDSQAWTGLPVRGPQYRFAPMAYGNEAAYLEGFSLPELMPNYVSGIVTSRDDFVTDIDRDRLRLRVTDFASPDLETSDFQRKYDLSENYQWKVAEQRKLVEPIAEEHFKTITYRPFDDRSIYYVDQLVFRRREKVMRHLIDHDNIGLCFNRSVEGTRTFSDIFVFKAMIGHHSLSLKEVNSIAPLYLYPQEGSLETGRRVNFDPKIHAEIRSKAGLTGTAGQEVAVIDYIYGVLHSSAYRSTYAQFLKIDFPRIPYPASPEVFAHVAEKGGQLRRLHLMEDAAIGETPYPFRGEGAGEVEKPEFKDGKVFINPHQWFEGVPPHAWTFPIGGYQPAQKWLKDRKGRTLSFDDVRHYQKIIKILAETDRIMKEIELPLD